MGHVSPAHAGMDPARGSRARGRGSFPRTRGDGPHPEDVLKEEGVFPPHTRGWTPACREIRDGKDVSPAHAGMDPGLRSTRRKPSSFPRTRGDGPQTGSLVRKLRGFPPHTRGWTLESHSSGCGMGVSPAHAGMDPRYSSTSAKRQRFPRTRGDGPWTVPRVFRVGMFPPHTRGWTRHHYPEGGRQDVSPAHAGMDPPHPCRRSGSSSFPRTRGDGPSPVSEYCKDSGFPPHTRGWTRVCRAHVRSGCVSPAHAGMDPLARKRWTLMSCFPRTRGDGPRHRWSDLSPWPFPPHTRGWTAPRLLAPRGRAVSPAHAGMDPSFGATFEVTASFPRTRGDGPLMDSHFGREGMFPPHTRGWTPP